MAELRKVNYVLTAKFQYCDSVSVEHNLGYIYYVNCCGQMSYSLYS